MVQVRNGVGWTRVMGGDRGKPPILAICSCNCLQEVLTDRTGCERRRTFRKASGLVIHLAPFLGEAAGRTGSGAARVWVCRWEAWHAFGTCTWKCGQHGLCPPLVNSREVHQGQVAGLWAARLQGHHSQHALPGVIQLWTDDADMQARAGPPLTMCWQRMQVCRQEPTGSENDGGGGGEVGRAARCDWSRHVRLGGTGALTLSQGSGGVMSGLLKKKGF